MDKVGTEYDGPAQCARDGGPTNHRDGASARGRVGSPMNNAGKSRGARRRPNQQPTYQKAISGLMRRKTNATGTGAAAEKRRTRQSAIRAKRPQTMRRTATNEQKTKCDAKQVVGYVGAAEPYWDGWRPCGLGPTTRRNRCGLHASGRSGDCERRRWQLGSDRKAWRRKR